MTSELIRAALDVVLIVLVGGGLVQAARLLRQLNGLKKSQAEMEAFVGQFGQTVDRAEAGIKNLRSAARESGDDLEKLVNKGTMLRDELQMIVESADQLASRLSQTGAHAAQPAVRAVASEKTPANEAAPAAKKQAAPAPAATSRAEKELLQALEKLG